MTGDCAFCGGPMVRKGAEIPFTFGRRAVHANRIYCSQVCRQKAYRLRRDSVTELPGHSVTPSGDSDGSSVTQEALNGCTGEAVLVPVEATVVPAPERKVRP